VTSPPASPATSTSTVSVSTVSASTVSTENQARLEQLVSALDERLALSLLMPSSEVQSAPSSDTAPVYERGCHSWWSSTSPVVCPLASGSPVIAILGDSHAAALTPALTALASELGFGAYSITKAGCPFVDVDVYSAEPALKPRKVPYEACTTWRRQAEIALAELKPGAVVLPLLTRRDLLDPRGTTTWVEGITRTLQTVTAPTVVLGENPKVPFDVPSCLKQHRSDIALCSFDAVVNQQRLDAISAAVGAESDVFVDVSSWYCLNQRCPSVQGNNAVWRDDNHLTATFAASIWPRLAAALVDLLAA
jgi:hypothetical protein